MRVILNDDEIEEYIKILDEVLQKSDNFRVEYVMNKLEDALEQTRNQNEKK